MSVEAEVAALEVLDLQALREVWRGRYGAPPALRSPGLLRLMLGWRMQAEAYGGLDAETRAALRRSGSSVAAAAPGSRLAREWKGVIHEVEATAEGFLYAGERYRSLSAVATRITGTKWNGRRFFGLGDQG